MVPLTVSSGMSVTVTLNDFVLVRWLESVAVQVTGVVPIAKVEPEAGVQVGVIGPSFASVAEAV